MSLLLDYSLLKTLHIISSTLLFGTGLGTFFFMVMATRTGNVEALRVTTRTVVIADFVFTTPAVIVQLLTGLLLMQRIGISWQSVWFGVVISLFCFVGALWLPVVWIQLKLRKLMADLPPGEPLPEAFVIWVRRWERMGYPAGIAMIGLFVMMVYKPFLG